MRTRPPIGLFLTAMLSCTAGPPTEVKPDYVAAAACGVTVTPSPASVSKPPSTDNTAVFAVKNTCGSPSGPVDFTASRTGAVASTSGTSPQFFPSPGLTAGMTKNVSVGYRTGATAGTGTVVLSATRDATTPPTTTSGSQTVTVTGPSPTVTTANASGIGTITATLNGSANPNGSSATGWFRYYTTSPGSCTDASPGVRAPASGGTALGSGTVTVAFNRAISGLTAGATYYFCAIASSPNGTSLGTVKSFTTGGAEGSPALRVGMFSTLDMIGQGPGGDTGAPTYGVVLGIPTPSEITSLIKQAELANVILILSLAGSRDNWTDPGTDANPGACLQYNSGEYDTRIKRFRTPQVSQAVADSVSNAFASHRAVFYLFDEPFLNSGSARFCTDAPKLDPAAVNSMGGIVKGYWPGAITLVRASADLMTTQGWAGSGSLGTGFWTKVDYAWSQFTGQHIPSAGETPRQFFDRERAKLDGWNLGMVPGHNFLNGGIYNDLGGVPACWDYDRNGSSGYVTGTASVNVPNGTKIPCGMRPVEETRFLSSPALLHAVVDAIWDDPKAPFLMLWAHANSTQPETVPFITYEARGDFTTELDYMITKAASRLVWNGWRPVK